MISLNETAGCRLFYDSLGTLFLLASSIVPGGKDSVEEILLNAHDRWQQRPEREWTLLNAQRDVAVEALQHATARPEELIFSEAVGSEFPLETETVLALPLLERVVFLMGSICHFGVEEISKLLRLPITDVRLARINAFRLLPKTRESIWQVRTA